MSHYGGRRPFYRVDVTPESTLSTLWEAFHADFNESSHTRLIDHPNADLDLLNTLFEVHKDKFTPLNRFADNPNCDAELLNKVFAETANFMDNPNTGGCYIVFQKLSFNPSTPENILLHLVETMPTVFDWNILGNKENRHVSMKVLTRIHENNANEYVKVNSVERMYVDGFFGDWPKEWVEAHYGVKLSESILVGA